MIMIISRFFKNPSAWLISGITYFGLSGMASAVAPNAVNDNLTGSPINQNQTRTISEASLIANDAGDNKSLKSVVSPSNSGAVVLWNNGASQVSYDPTAVAGFIALDSGATADDTFTYTLQGSDGADDTAVVTVRIAGVNDAPTLAGISGTYNTTDKVTSTPFSGATVGDPDTAEQVTVTVVIDTAAKGTFTNLNGFTTAVAGTYTYSGSVANATTRLRGLTFNPTQNRVAPASQEDAVFSVSVSDGDLSSATSTRTARVTSVNDLPVVAPGGTRSMNDNTTLTIFSGVTLTDPDFEEALVVTVTFDETKGSFSGTHTLSGSQAARVLTLSSQSVASAQAALRALVFVPVANRVAVGVNENQSFSIAANDGDGSASGSLTVTVTGVNDAPVLTPASVGPFNMVGGGTVSPFGSVTLTDADLDEVGAGGGIGGNPSGDTFTAVITLTIAPAGSIISSSFSAGGAYSGTRSQVEAAIRNVQYLAPALAGSYQISLAVTDSSGAASNVVTGAVSVTQPVPGMSGLVAGQQLADNAVIFPFATAAFNNFGGAERLVEVRLDSDAKGSFDILGSFVKSTVSGSFVYRMTGNSVTATDAIQLLRFKPTANRITGTSEAVTFTITVGGTLSTDTISVLVIPFNDAPTISGASPTIRINDDEVCSPFSTMTLVDVDAGGTQPLTVSLSLIGQDPATNLPRAGGGVLAAAPGAPAVAGVTFTPMGNDVYRLLGAPVAVTTYLRELVFTPTANINPVGQRETISFTISVSDLNGGTAQNQATAVIVTSVNGAPQIGEVPLPSQQPFPVAASGNGSTFPFRDLTVSDEGEVTFTITLDNAAKGALIGSGFTSGGAGVYSMTGTPAAVTLALQALSYEIDLDYVFPPDQPGLTTFTLAASDTVNTTTKELTIFIRERNVSHIVTSTADAGVGSLRQAVNFAGNGDMIVFDFSVDAFPVTLVLEEAINIERNLTIIGSGVKMLTIQGAGSDGLFRVTAGARLTVEQVKFKGGVAASYGGAIAVDSGSALLARFCSFEGNSAGQYGGAIDVYEGELVVENCLFYQNRIVGSTAKAGGAISVYSALASSITNSTFVENQQENAGGDGGGAIYAENADLAEFFNLQVEHCTFSNNSDAAISGSAVLAASAGLRVNVRNNIFADIQGRVLDVLGGGEFKSLGGNIATDSTVTTYTQGGQPQNVILLNQASDKRSTPPLLKALANNGGATKSCALETASPALNSAVVVNPVNLGLGLDQRGYWRGGSLPDVGAFEEGAFKRVNINEIMVEEGPGGDFIEFYNPRDSEPLNMAGLKLFVDGVEVPSFTAGALLPGAGFAWMSSVDLDEELGSIELRNALGQPVLMVDYVARFSENGSEVLTAGQSINRYPRYEGGFLPHQRVVERVTGLPGDDSSPGEDVDGSELGGGNAPPIAVVDVAEDLTPLYSILADETLSPELLLNDIEFDRPDTLKFTEVMSLIGGDVVNQELLAIDGVGGISLSDLPPGLTSTLAPNGAVLTIAGDNLSLVYDPTASSTMIALSAGESVTDIWAYTMRDYDPSGAPQSRGADAVKQAQNIKKATSYFAVTVTGVNEAPEPGDDAVATVENQAIRMLADATLLAPMFFDFGDQDGNYQDFDATGAPVTLKPAPPTTALLDNDDDVDNDNSKADLLLVAVHTTAVPANLLSTTSALGATVVLDIRAERKETSIVYDPRSSANLNALSAGEVATDTFYYSVFDRHGERGVGKVTVTVIGVNDVPRAMDDGGFVANEDELFFIPGSGLLLNDVDPDQNDLGDDDLPVIVTPLHSTSVLGATLSFDGTTVSYDPTTIATYQELARNETISDSFFYSIKDDKGGVSQARVTILVEGRNDRPVAQNDLLAIWENAITTVNGPAGLLANDYDVDINGTPPDDDPWVLPQRNLVTPLGAVLDINPDGSYRYNANSVAIDSLIQGELAVETFPYTITDNSRTTATDDSFKVLANRVEVTVPVLLNDAVVGSSATAIAGYRGEVGNPGIVVIESPHHALRDGLLIEIAGYSGAGSYNGVFPITSIDRDHFSVPVAFKDDPAANRGEWRPWFEIVEASASSHGGEVEIISGQSITYTPTSGFYGVETFSYTIHDGAGGQDVAKVRVEVMAPGLNGFLSASDDRFHLGMGESGVVVDVLGNDHILPSSGGALTITATSPLSGATGSLEIINAGKNLRYTPSDLTLPVEESFSYTVFGAGEASAQATVSFKVVDRSGLLSGSDDAYFVVLGTSNNQLNVLVNDPSLPSFPVTSTLVAINGSATPVTTGSGGTASISANKISYTPPAAVLTDTFTYTARDISGATTTQTVKVRVVPAAVDFFATADHYTVVAGSGPIQLAVLINDGAVLNPTATLSVVNLGLDTDLPPSFQRVSIVGGNTISYTPPADARTEEFTYEISIGTVARREARITITVVDQFKTAPDPEDDFFHVAKNSGPHSLDVLKNDLPYPAAGWTWTVRSATDPSHGGSLSIQAGGTSLAYSPALGFFGTESFTYTIQDAFGATATASVSIRVGVLSTAPDRFALLADSLDNSLDVLANDDLLDSYARDYSIGATGIPDHGGSLVIDGSGPDNRLSYTPLAGFSGVESFTYTVVDQTGGTRDESVNVLVLAQNSDRDQAELRVQITGINDIPVLTGTANRAITDKQSVNPFAAVAISDLDVFGNQVQTVTVNFNASFGTVVAPGMTTTGAGNYRVVGTPAVVTTALRGIVFTPFENFIDYISPGQADVVFTLSITDGYIASPIVSLTTINVTPINDAPVISNPIPNQVVQVNAFTRAFYLPNHFADVDDNVPGGQLTWTVTGNTNPTLFTSVTVNATSRSLVIAYAAGKAGFSDITVRGTDRGGLLVSTSFRITVEGPPVIILAPGETKPPAAALVSGSTVGFSRDYKQSFRVSNTGTLPVTAFVVNVSDLNVPVDGIIVAAATFSTNENGTPTNFLDDATSATGVTILRQSNSVTVINYNLPIAPGGSVVVHLTYRVSSVALVSIRPTIRISLSTASPTGAIGVKSVTMSSNGEVVLKLNVAAHRSYRLEYSTNMVTWNSWLSPLPVSDFSREITVIDDGYNTGLYPSLAPMRFYRLVDITIP